MRILLSIFLLGLSTLCFARPNIVVSIKPLALIVQEIAGDKILLEQLLPDQASHHDYPMKMSDHKRLYKADLIIWIGPDLESFLSRPLANISAEKQLALMELSGIEWPDADNDAHDEHHHNQDPHLWLNPKNVEKIANILSGKLAGIDAQNEKFYKENTTRFIEKLNQLDKNINQQMQPIQGRGFAVYHHAYNHYVARYHLKQLGYLTLTPERKSGAKHLAALYKALANDGKCIFAEPLMDKSRIEKIAAKYQLRVGYLDVMGIKADSYSQLMQSISDNFSTCLSDRRG